MQVTGAGAIGALRLDLSVYLHTSLPHILSKIRKIVELLAFTAYFVLQEGLSREPISVLEVNC